MVSQRTPGRRSSAKSAHRNGIDDLGSRDALVEGLSARPGEHFFKILSRSLAVALNVRFGFVSELTGEPGCVKVLAFWTGEAFGENFTYPVRGTPCERVLAKNLVSIQKDVQKAYPEDAWLGEIGAESYMAVPLLGADGSALGHLGVLHDAPMETSEEKLAVLQAFAIRAAGELQRNNEHAVFQQRLAALEAIVDAPVGILQVDEAGRISLANHKLEAMFGYEHDELMGRPIEQLVPGKLRRRHAEHREHFLRDTHDRPMGAKLDIEGRRKDGSTFPVRVSLSSAGRGAIAIIADATMVTGTIHRLKQGHARLEAVVEALPELTFVLDGNGVYLDFVSADGISPYVSPDEFLGKCMTDVLPAEVAEPAIAHIKLALETNEVQRLRYTLNRPDGQRSYEGRFVRLDSERVVLFVRDLMDEQRLIDEAGRNARSKPDSEHEIERRMEWRNPYGLSYREFSVLHLLKGGTTDKEIANDLGISVFTVNKHVSNILTKMNAASRTEATIRALQEGLID